MKINHVLIKTRDLVAMAEFLKQVTGLQKGYRPPFPFPGIWIYSEDKPIFHLVQISPNKEQSEYLGTSQNNHVTGVFDHIAIEGADYSALISRLHQFDIEYTERTVPLTNEHQVFVTGPDNVKLEMLFSKDKENLNKLKENKNA